MSSTMSVKLTEEQQKFLNSLEEEFKDRYTENDEEFKAVLNEELPLPPIIENWREFRQPDERYGNDRRNRGRDGGCDRYSYDRYNVNRGYHLQRYVQIRHFQNPYRPY